MAQPKKPSHEQLGLLATNMKDFYTRPRPPENFDPTAASEEDLAKFGLPKRPDQKQQPRAHALWRRMFGRRLKYIEPQLRPRRYRTRANSKRARIEFGPAGGSTPGRDSWAGTYCVARGGPPLVYVGAMWQLPSIWIPESGPFVGADEYRLATWVGLDGIGIDDVLQGGVDQHIGSGNGNGCSAWAEFFPSPPATASNFPVSAGDAVIFQALYLPDPNPLKFGEVLMVNITQAVATIVVVCPGPDTTFSGNTAEWVVETPTLADGDLAALPGFSPVAFVYPFAVDRAQNEAPAAQTYSTPMQNYGPGYGRTSKADSQVVANPIYDPDIFGVVWV